MAKKYPITPGEVFGRLTVLSVAPKSDGDIHRRVYAQCQCGAIRNIMYSLLVTGKTVSCGCYRRTRRITHGHARTGVNRSYINRTYAIYRDMLTRCYNENYREYYLYGGRGIRVCERWQNSFENFLEDMGERPENLTLERNDYDGDYSPDNCRWASIIEQANNKRTNVILEYKGRKQTIAQWARELEVPATRLYQRRYAGWTDSQILSRN